MRSIFIHLRDALENDVAEFLQRAFPFQQGPPWILDVDGEQCLHIDFYHDGKQEFDAEDWLALARALGKAPATSVMADVSGRFPGDKQVCFFVAIILGQFEGLAQDEYTKHYWTADQVQSGFRVQGHKFFDYSGWST